MLFVKVRLIVVEHVFTCGEHVKTVDKLLCRHGSGTVVVLNRHTPNPIVRLVRRLRTPHHYSFALNRITRRAYKKLGICAVVVIVLKVGVELETVGNKQIVNLFVLIISILPEIFAMAIKFRSREKRSLRYDGTCGATGHTVTLAQVGQTPGHLAVIKRFLAIIHACLKHFPGRLLGIFREIGFKFRNIKDDGDVAIPFYKKQVIIGAENFGFRYHTRPCSLVTHSRRGYVLKEHVHFADCTPVAFPVTVVETIHIMVVEDIFLGIPLPFIGKDGAYTLHIVATPAVIAQSRRKVVEPIVIHMFFRYLVKCR